MMKRFSEEQIIKVIKLNEMGYKADEICLQFGISHGTKFGSPFIHTGRNDSVLASQIWHCDVRFIFFQDNDNLAIRKSLFFHVDLLRLVYEKILLKTNPNLRGDYNRIKTKLQ